MRKHKNWSSLLTRARSRPWLWVSGILLALSPIWTVVASASVLEFLLTFNKTEVGSFVLSYGQWIAMLLGFLLLYLAVRPEASISDSPKPSLRRRFEISQYISSGLDWQICDHSEDAGKAVAVLRIAPTTELPQPLEIRMVCAGRIASMRPRFYRDSNDGTKGELEMDSLSRDGQKEVSFILRAPKLHSPSYLEVTLRSVGNARIKVLEVRRNPEGVRPRP